MCCCKNGRKKIVFYDSLGSTGKKYLEALHRYLADEYLDKKKKILDMESWDLISDQSNTPQQMNGKFSYVVLLGIFKFVCSIILNLSSKL